MESASAISHGHDQQRGGAQSLRPIDQVLRCRGTAPRRDVVMVAPGGHALAIEPQLGSPLDPDRLRNTLSALARKYQVPGAQLAIHHGGETMAVEVGELEYGTGHAVTRDAAFPIGSITKTFTATVAMILVADGDLELDDPLGEYLSELGNLGDDLTLRQLLSHTGGLASEPEKKVHTASIRRFVLGDCRSENLVLPPGTGFSYSNIGYILVGHLIETITGMTWWDAMESILLQPLGIEPTFLGAAGRRPLGRLLATGHSVNTAIGKTQPVEQSLVPAEAPAGGLAVSAADLVTLGLIQVNSGTPALLPTAYAEQMRQAVPDAEPLSSADGWGLGLAVFGHGNGSWVGHFGALDGTDCDFRLDPVSGCVVAFTSNANTGLGMWYELVNELRQAGLPIRDCSHTKVRGRPIVPPPDCVGSYLNGKTEVSVAVTETGALGVAIDGYVADGLILFEDFSFSMRKQPSIRFGRFLRDPVTGDLERIQFGLHVARRQSVTNEKEMTLKREQVLTA